MTIKGLIARIRYFFKYRKMDTNPVRTHRKNGVVIGENVQLLNAHIDWNHGFLIRIGNNVTITNAAILAHDASTHIFMGYSKVGGVVIGDNVFIGYGSIILPGVNIGNNCIVGAGSIVSKDVPDGSVVAGNPARVICRTSDYLQKHKDAMEYKPVFHKAWELSAEEKIKAREEVILNHGGYDL